MAKKLTKIEEEILAQSEKFYEHFWLGLNDAVKKFIYDLTKQTNVFIFSGIIRDFFIDPRKNDFRDIDLIIEDDLEIDKLYSDLNIKKNSFGGYKIEIQSVIVDLWVIKKTWGLNNGQLTFEFDIINAIPKTTFFNFSSIVYDIENKNFIIGKDFLRFLRDKKIEIVSEINPYPELCIVNSIYYKEKLNFPLGKKLKKYLATNYIPNKNKLNEIQLKHFNCIKYNAFEIEKEIEKL